MKRKMMFMAMAAMAAVVMGMTALAGCGPIPSGAATSALETSPAAVANKTTLDEKAAIAAETGYTAASTLGATLAQAGLIDKAAFKALDAQGYKAVQIERAAYAAGNAAGFASAIDQINHVVTDIRSLAKGSN